MRCGVLLVIKNNKDGYAPSIDHRTGRVLAYVLATHQDQALVKVVNLLQPFGIKRFFTDAWGAYERILDPHTHLLGKKNTQKIERKHLTLRTRIKRLARETVCFLNLS